jgi:hypothetical protein
MRAKGFFVAAGLFYLLNAKTRRASLRAGFRREKSLLRMHHAGPDQSSGVRISFPQVRQGGLVSSSPPPG